MFSILLVILVVALQASLGIHFKIKDVAFFLSFLFFFFACLYCKTCTVTLLVRCLRCKTALVQPDVRNDSGS